MLCVLYVCVYQPVHALLYTMWVDGLDLIMMYEETIRVTTSKKDEER